MSTLEQARATQLRNIETATGKTIDELRALFGATGLSKHTELREWAMRELGLSHGNANALVHYALNTDGQSAAAAANASLDDIVAAIYTGPKAQMRPIHDRLMEAAQALGPFEIAPKKGYVSLRRAKQFAMLGPATNTRFEVGLNMKDIDGTDRLVAQPAGGMCQYKVKVTDVGEVDDALVGWLRAAYEQAGA
ncbi:MAG: DUF5655 domain-containing protein [Ardenticatenales bacterium]